MFACGLKDVANESDVFSLRCIALLQSLFDLGVLDLAGLFLNASLSLSQLSLSQR